MNGWIATWLSADSALWKSVTLAITIGIGILILLLACKILRISEMDSAIRIVRKKIGLLV
jgi:hypothetical protein